MLEMTITQTDVGARLGRGETVTSQRCSTAAHPTALIGLDRPMLYPHGPGDVRLAVRAADVTRQRSMEHEGIVHKLCPRQVLCVHHKLVRFKSPDLSRGKQALWRARPPIVRSLSRSKWRQRQTRWSCAFEFSHPISSAATCGSSTLEGRIGRSPWARSELF
jgi:hypothetical protein